MTTASTRANLKRILGILIAVLMAAQVCTAAFAVDLPAAQIDSPEELFAIADDLSGDYVLAADIDLSDYPSQAVIAGDFSGTLDGAGHSVTGLNITSADGDAALFASLSGTVRNLTLGGTVSASASAANSTLRVGSIAAVSSGTISGCVSNAAVGFIGTDKTINSEMTAHVGGLVGVNSGYITRSAFSGIINASVSADKPDSILGFGDAYAKVNVYTGGIAGTSSGGITEAFNSGSVSAVAGATYSTTIVGVSRNYSYAYAYAGGIAGCMSGGSVGDVYNSGIVSVTRSGSTGTSAGRAYAYAGGLFGVCRDAASSTDCAYAVGGVSVGANFSSSYLGALIGSMSASALSECYYLDSVAASGLGSVSVDSGAYYMALDDDGMKLRTSFSGFDFDDIWFIDDAQDTSYPYPQLIQNPFVLRILGIKINNPASKLEYVVGDALDTTGLVVTAVYNNGTEADLEPEAWSAECDTLNTVGTGTVTVSLNSDPSITAEYEISIIPLKVTNAVIKTLPAKLTYYSGEALDTAGLVLERTFNNSAKDTITSGFSAACPDIGTVGTQSVSVVYEANDTTFNLSYNITVKDAVTSIELVSAPAKSDYFLGDASDTLLNIAGLSVKLNAYDSTSRTISSGFAINDTVLSGASLPSGFRFVYDLSAVGDATVKVYYKELTVPAEFTVNVVELALSGLKIKTPASKLEYVVGDALDTTGLAVAAVYNNGASVDLDPEDWSAECSTLDTVGVGTVTVSLNSDPSITTEYAINIVPVKVTNAVIKTLPAKLTYYLGEALDSEGLTLELTFNNGEVDIVDSGFSVMCDSMASLGTQSVNVVYRFGGDTFNLTYDILIVDPIVAIELVTPPTKDSYVPGSSLSTAGLVVRLVSFNAQASVVNTGFSASNGFRFVYDFSNSGTATVKIYYKQLTVPATFTVTVVTPVKSISLNATEITLRIGETFQLTADVLPADATDSSVTWTTNTGYRISVSDGGLVTALKLAASPSESSSVKVFATANDGSGVRASCDVTVLPAPTVDITFGGDIKDSIEYKVTWYMPYSSAKFALGYETNTFKNEYTAEWSSNFTERVVVDKDTGVVSNIGFFNSRVATITVALKNSKGETVATDSIKVIFYKFRIQLAILRVGANAAVSDETVGAQEVVVYASVDAVDRAFATLKKARLIMK